MLFRSVHYRPTVHVFHSMINFLPPAIVSDMVVDVFKVEGFQLSLLTQFLEFLKHLEQTLGRIFVLTLFIRCNAGISLIHL